MHNWLPDAHSEAPPPVSALLSAALLPAVLLVAWRSEQALAPVVGERHAADRPDRLRPRLARRRGPVPLALAAWKRLLAYSSLEHMGVIALGIGFGTPLALAGVAVHIAGHAIAKALGFYAATPLLAPRAARGASTPSTGIGRSEPALGATMGISLAALAGLPPSPLFVERGADRRRRLPGRTPLGGERDRAPARARLPRARPRADRDDRRRQPAARTTARSPACAA